MTIDELKETVAGEPCQDLRDLLPGQRALLDLHDEILALVEAVRDDILDENGEPCDCDRSVCSAWRAFNAKLGSMGRPDDSR